MNRFRKMAKRSLFIPLLAAVLFSPFAAVLQSSPAYANNFRQMTALSRLKVQDGIKMLEYCENSAGQLIIPSGHGNSVDADWKFYYKGNLPGQPVIGGQPEFNRISFTLPAYYDNTEDPIYCSQLFSRYGGLFGISDGNAFLNDAGYSEWNGGYRKFSGGCNNQRSTELNCLKSAIMKRVSNYSEEADPQMLYVRNKAILDARVRGSDPGGCYVHWTSKTSPGELDVSAWAGQYNDRTGDEGILGTIDDPRVIRLVNNSQAPTALKDFFAMSEGGDGDDGWEKAVHTSVNTDGSRLTEGNPVRCVDLATQLSNEVSQAYINWVAQHPDDNPGTGLGSSDTIDGDGDEEKTTCAVTTIGWIVCPVVNFMASLADGAFSFLQDTFLATSTDIVDTSNDTYKAWTAMRDVANVAFVIAFLFIIFSQATSFGLNNYGIKKMLPRLIAAAILVNASFFICQLAVDISNILGYSLRGFFDSIAGSIQDRSSEIFSDGAATGDNLWGGVSLTVLAGAAGIVSYIALGALLPMLLAGVVALLMIFLMLVLREMLIVLLIVIAPLAFVAFLLPNTEQFFKKWQKMFTSLLLLFPIIAVIFGASSLASSVLESTWGGDGSEQSMIGQIVAAGVLVIPLFLVPVVLKGALNGIGNIGATLNKMGGRLGGAARDLGKEQGKDIRLAQQARWAQGKGLGRAPGAQRFLQRGARRNAVNAGREALIKEQSAAYIAGLATGDTRLGKKMVGQASAGNANAANRFQAQSISTLKSQESEATKNAETLLNYEVSQALRENPKTNPNSIYEAAMRSGDKSRAIAAQNILLGQGGFGAEQFRTIASKMESDGSMTADISNALRRNLANNHAGINKNVTDLAQWAFQPGKYQTLAEAASAREDNNVWRDISLEGIVDQTPAALRRAFANGSIPKEKAIAVLHDPRLSVQLTDDHRRAIAEMLSDTEAAQNGLSEFRNTGLAQQQKDAQKDQGYINIVHEEALRENEQRYRP